MLSFSELLEVYLNDLSRSTQEYDDSRKKKTTKINDEGKEEEEVTGTDRHVSSNRVVLGKMELKIKTKPPPPQIRIVGKAIGTEKYDIEMLFNDIEFVDELDLFSYQLDKNRIIKKLSMDGNNVQVYCSCPDFIYLWAIPDRQAGALCGPPLPAIKPKGTKIGLCKHLLRLVSYLKDKGILVDHGISSISHLEDKF